MHCRTFAVQNVQFLSSLFPFLFSLYSFLKLFYLYKKDIRYQNNFHKGNSLAILNTENFNLKTLKLGFKNLENPWTRIFKFSSNMCFHDLDILIWKCTLKIFHALAYNRFKSIKFLCPLRVTNYFMTETCNFMILISLSFSLHNTVYIKQILM